MFDLNACRRGEYLEVDCGLVPRYLAFQTESGEASTPICQLDPSIRSLDSLALSERAQLPAALRRGLNLPFALKRLTSLTALTNRWEC